MSTQGASHLYRPVQPEPAYILEPGDSYFLIKIHDAQAFFPAIVKQARYLLFSSSVETSFLPGRPTRSLHKLTAFRKNTPYHLGVNTNLTGWLPAGNDDKVRLDFKYIVMQDAPMQNLVDHMEQLQLETVLSLIRPELAVAAKISEIVGHIVSSLLHEGESVEIFPFQLDLNLAELKSGYYAVLGATKGETYPNIVEIDRGNLTGHSGHDLAHYSYVVIQVQSIKRRGPEAVRRESWGELLQVCKEKALNATIRNEYEREDVLQQWKTSLELVSFLAHKDRSFLQREIDAVIAEAHDAVEHKLLPPTKLEAQALNTYPDEWQELLHFSTPEELRRAVRDYQAAVAFSEGLLKQYQEPEH